MPLGDHLEELRARIIRSLIVIAAFFVLSWIFREFLLSVLMGPHLRTAAGTQISPSLKYRDYMEPVAAQLKISLVVSTVVAAPFLLYQIWAFIAPGLYRNERSFFIRLLGVSILCFVSGAVFGYFLFIPLALRFLLSLAPPTTEPMLMISSYISLFMALTLALGIVFQTPLVIYYLVKWNIVSAEKFKQNRKNAILTAFILSAFFTPPDPATQVMMAVPVIALYELGLLVAAPSNDTFIVFLKLFGLISSILTIAAIIYFYVPIARLTVLEGSALVNGSVFSGGQSGYVRRGTRLSFADNSGALILSLGLLSENIHIALSQHSQVLIRNKSRIVLEHGSLLYLSPHGGREVVVELPRGYARLGVGEAELHVKDRETFQVQVADGEVEIFYDGRSHALSAGRKRIFQPEGEELTDEFRERWGAVYKKLQ